MNQSRTDQLTHELREEITSGRIAAGHRLPSESELIATHQVSRTVVREALGRLQAQGLIRTKRGSGSYALTPPPEPVAGNLRSTSSLSERLELIDYRIGIETRTAELAADSASTLTGQMRATAEAFAASLHNPAQAIQHDFALHMLIAKASGNAYLADALAALGEVMISMPRTRLEHASTEANRRDRHHAAALEHLHIVEAIEAGDPLTASAAMRLHLANSKQRVRKDTT